MSLMFVWTEAEFVSPHVCTLSFPSFSYLLAFVERTFVVQKVTEHREQDTDQEMHHALQARTLT